MRNESQSAKTTTKKFFILACCLAVSAISIRGLAMSYASRGTSVLAQAVSLAGKAQDDARNTARHAALLADRITAVSLALVLSAAAAAGLARYREGSNPLVPVLLLVVYVFLFLMQV